ncbi:MAG TPA: hypothetical protein VN238_15270 [Solirubrobacteraceae bacterium]|nr:hypothetical protein [Solirubrobacteraceae bacterium]
MSVRTAHIMRDTPRVPTDPAEGLRWHAVRHHLDIRAFGANAYVGEQPGDLVIEAHDEDEPEELYVVVAGAATFVVDGETIEAPHGTLVLVTPPSHRVAHATEPGTVILAIGAVPGKPFEPSEWELRELRKAGLV